MRCANCGNPNPDNSKFCNHCAAPLPLLCQRCGWSNAPGSRFCGQCAEPCGAALGASIGESAAELRTICVLFSDLVGSSALAERLDPEEWHKLLHEYQTRAGACVAALEGHVAQYLGDALLAYFGYPLAHEDDPRRAVRAALAILRAVAEIAPAAEAKYGLPLQVRIGVHLGPVVIGDIGGAERRERLALGEAPNVAARLQALAGPNAIVISKSVYDRVSSYFECEELGPQNLKGLSHAVAAYQVVAEPVPSSRVGFAPESRPRPLIDRQAETKRLYEHWARIGSGKGSSVLVIGEAGIGKSRLLGALRELARKEPALELETWCSPYHRSSAFYPFIELIERRAGLVATDGLGQKRAKLEQWLTRELPTRADLLPAFASLLAVAGDSRAALDPKLRRQQIFTALSAWLHELGARIPLLIVLEDLQWADPSSLELVAALVADLPPRALFAMTCRPEFHADFYDSPRVERLVLGRLDTGDARQLISETAGYKELPDAVLEQVLAKADGVPLFAEELTKAILESGHLRPAEDRFEIDDTLVRDLVPSTIQGSLLARLDRLGSGKALAQLASALGREFGYEMLAAVAELDEATLERELAVLEKSQLVFKASGTRERSYVFKHALIRDVAYHSLLKSTRRQLHGRIAHTLSVRFPEMIEAQPELMAQHCAAAALVEDAVQYWTLAGHRAAERSACSEAISHYTSALEQLLFLPDSLERRRRELELRSALGVTLIARRGFSAREVEAAYQRAHELLADAEDMPLGVLYGTWAVKLVRGDREGTAELVPHFRRILDGSNDPLELLVASSALGVRALFGGDYGEARRHFTLARELCLGLDDEQRRALLHEHGFDGSLWGHLYLASCDWAQGYIDRSREGFRTTLALAEADGQAYVLAMALTFGANLARERRDVEAARYFAMRLLEVVTESGFAHWLACAKCLEGWVALQDGDVAAALGAIERGLATFREIGAEVPYAYYLSYLAEARARAGDLAQARSTIEEALELSRRTDACSEPELLRLRGELDLQLEHRADALNAFRDALAITRRQGARFYELRAALSLFSAARTPAERNEGLRALAEVYRWFSDGFDVVDLKQARAALDAAIAPGSATVLGAAPAS